MSNEPKSESAVCQLPNIRELNRGSPASVNVRFVRDITNEEVEAVGKAIVAAQRLPSQCHSHDALLEQCAALCDAEAERATRDLMNARGTAKGLAAAIRALKSSPATDSKSEADRG